MIQILSFCTNPTILPVMDRLVNKQEGWTGHRAADLRTAAALVAEHDFDVVLLGAGTGDEEREALAAITKDKSTRYINHYGGGSGLLYAEVTEALQGN